MTSLASRGKTTCYQCKGALGLGVTHFHGLYFCGMWCEALWWKEWRERLQQCRSNKEREKGVKDLFRAWRAYSP